MTTTESLYRDSLLKWLRNRREHPQDNTPEPEFPVVKRSLTGRRLIRIRAEVLRDFDRKE